MTRPGAWLARPADGAGLAALRALLGAILVYSTIRFWSKGWIEELYLQPKFHFTYLGFDWVRPWPGLGMHFHYAVMALAALGLCLGAYTRACAAVFFLLFSYAELIEKATYLNHYYLVSLLAALLAVVPAGAAFSVDAWRRQKRGQAPAGVQRWAYAALRTQLAIVYFYAGFAKLGQDWLLFAEPLSTWLAARADFPVLGPVLAQPWAAYAMSYFGAAYDLTLPLWLSWRKTRAVAYAAAILFHVTVWLLFPIGVFSWVMLASTTIFFAPSWPRAWLERVAPSLRRRWRSALSSPSRGIDAGTLGGRSRLAAPGSTVDAGARGDGRRSDRPPEAKPPPWLLAALGLHLAVQALLPMRFSLYPGRVNWHEQGFRFSWRVMLIEKSGQVEFLVERPDGSRQRIYAQRELTPLQYKMMSTQPDMIHQYALHLSRRAATPQHPAPAVYAVARAALNGRRGQALIDPDLNLAAIPRSLAPQPFVLPLESPRIPPRRAQ